MKRYFRPVTRKAQQGSVAVEAALCIALILVPLVFLVFSFGRLFWHYTAVQKALHDASLYMAKAPMNEVRSGAAETISSFIIEREIADLDSGTTVAPWILCGFRPNPNTAFMTFGACGIPNLVPVAVQANAVMTIANPLYFRSNSGQITFTHTSTIRHAGK